MTFSAVILAGGKSSRMGRDKAFLEVDGQPLLTRQIQIVRAAGAVEVFISGRSDADYSAFDGEVLQDRFADVGPLAGIEAALNAATSPLLLVLAVDMPHISADFLRQLAAHCTEATGVIPRVGEFIEPLAAFYPKVALGAPVSLPAASPTVPPARMPALPERGGGAAAPPYHAKHFAECCVAAGLARFIDIPEADARFFANWNSPADCHA